MKNSFSYNGKVMKNIFKKVCSSKDLRNFKIEKVKKDDTENFWQVEEKFEIKSPPVVKNYNEVKPELKQDLYTKSIVLIKKRQKQIQENLKLKAEKELSECTFSPRTNYSNIKNSKNSRSTNFNNSTSLLSSNTFKPKKSRENNKSSSNINLKTTNYYNNKTNLSIEKLSNSFTNLKINLINTQSKENGHDLNQIQQITGSNSIQIIKDKPNFMKFLKRQEIWNEHIKEKNESYRAYNKHLEEVKESHPFKPETIPLENFYKGLNNGLKIKNLNLKFKKSYSYKDLKKEYKKDNYYLLKHRGKSQIFKANVSAKSFIFS